MLKAFFIFILFIASQLLSGFIAVMLGNWENIRNDQPIEWLLGAGISPTSLALSMILASALLFILLWLLRLTSNHPLASILFRRSKKDWRLLGAFILVGVGLTFLLHPFDLDDGGLTDLIRQGKNNVLMMLMICVVGPIIEEVVFRDGIQRQLSAIGLKPWLAILTTSVSFGIVHGNFAQALPAIVLGVLLGWLYYKTGDLRLCVPAHIFNNSLAALSLHIPELETYMEAWPTLLFYVMGSGVVALGGWIFYRHYSK